VEIDEASEYRVMPDTGLVMGFQYTGGISSIAPGGHYPLSHAGISGLSDQHRLFRNDRGTGSVLVYFRVGGASSFFSTPLHELFRESVPLDNFVVRAELLCLQEQLCEARSDRQRVNAVEQFLIKRLTPTLPDQLVLAALDIIHKVKGNVRIAMLAKQLHTSQSPLEKRFRKVVGTSPKKYASIVRLKNVLHIGMNRSSLTQLGYEAGFYDQAHFIKEFRSFTGQSPEQFFAGP
jgi:AraC-like DNA-binding protein